MCILSRYGSGVFRTLKPSKIGITGSISTNYQNHNSSMKTLNGLSIGSYVRYQGKPSQIIEMSTWEFDSLSDVELGLEFLNEREITKEYHYHIKPKDLSPIPITPESLGWVGFEEIKPLTKQIKIENILLTVFNIKEVPFLEIVKKGRLELSLREIHHIHQIQAALALVDPEAVLEYRVS